MHNNLTNPYYLRLKQECSLDYTFGVKNIQKSEVRPLHKFEQDLKRRLEWRGVRTQCKVKNIDFYIKALVQTC